MTTKAKGKKPPKAKRADENNIVTLRQLCTQLKVDPVDARVKLRAAVEAIAQEVEEGALREGHATALLPFDTCGSLFAHCAREAPDTGHGGGVVDIKLKIALLQSLAIFFVDFFKPRRRLEVENLFLRHQLSIALAACATSPSTARQ